MKKLFGFFAMAGAVAFTATALTSCGGSQEKIGFIFLHDQNSTYDTNFINAAKAACKSMGVKAVMKTNIPEGDECYDAAKDLVNQGCKAVFADSFGHEEFLLKAAKEYPTVEFCHATGVMACTANQENFHNAFASIYEGRYVTGVAAGLKLNEMIASGKITAEQAIMGYVGAYPYAEVVSGYTSFYLGAKSVCPSVTMAVRYTNSWFSVEGEASACTALIEKDHAVLISQHADSQGAPGVCKEKNVPNVFYNGTNENLKNSYLIASRINWEPYFKYMIESVKAGTKMGSDWYGTLENGAVEVLKLNTAVAAEGTQAKVDEVIAALKGKTLSVFDTSTFTVNGEHLTEVLADCDGDFKAEKQVISNGVFQESLYRSAPYFELRIDGITEISS